MSEINLLSSYGTEYFGANVMLRAIIDTSDILEPMSYSEKKKWEIIEKRRLIKKCVIVPVYFLCWLLLSALSVSLVLFLISLAPSQINADMGGWCISVIIIISIMLLPTVWQIHPPIYHRGKKY